MLKLGAAAGGISHLTAAPACLAVLALAACGSSAGAASAANAGRNPSAVARAAPDAGQTSRARTGSDSSRSAGSPAANANIKHAGFLNGVSCVSPANCIAVGEYYQ